MSISRRLFLKLVGTIASVAPLPSLKWFPEEISWAEIHKRVLRHMPPPTLLLTHKDRWFQIWEKLKREDQLWGCENPIAGGFEAIYLFGRPLLWYSKGQKREMIQSIQKHWKREDGWLEILEI